MDLCHVHRPVRPVRHHHVVVRRLHGLFCRLTLRCGMGGFPSVSSEVIACDALDTERCSSQPRGDQRYVPQHRHLLGGHIRNVPRRLVHAPRALAHVHVVHPISLLPAEL